MKEETEQGHKQKKDKDSSTDKIDSLIISHDQNKNQQYQSDHYNIHQTEQLIDKLINEKSTQEKQDDSLDPTADIIDDKIKKPFCEPTKANDNQKQEPEWTSAFNNQKKEEIFELENPEPTDGNNIEKSMNLKEETNPDRPKKAFATSFKQQSIKQQKKPIMEKKSKSFSFHLPKLNFIRRKSKKNPTKDNESKIQFQEVKKEEEKHFTSSEEKNYNKHENGRIHGVAQVLEKEEKPAENTDVNPKKHEKNKEKSFFKSSDKSFNLFKKKTDKKKENRIPTESNNQDPKHDKIKTENIVSTTQVTTNNEPFDKEVIELLKITDDLLGKLPDEVIEEFSQSDEFSLYEKVMRKYDILK